MTKAKKKSWQETEQEVRNQLGIWDGSTIGDISKNVTPWVGVNSDGQKVIYRCPSQLMAYAVHNIGRHFARSKMDFSRPGHHKVSVTFDVYRYDDPTCEIKGVIMVIPYQINVTFKVEDEKFTSKEAVNRINQIQDGNA